MNAPDRFLTWRWESEEEEERERLKYQPDSKKPNAGYKFFLYMFVCSKLFSLLEYKLNLDMNFSLCS
jgi:hypothetical protein